MDTSVVTNSSIKMLQSNSSSDLSISDDSETQKLVPYSDSSDSEYPKVSKIRQKGIEGNQINWFAQQNKLRRERGQKYLGRKKEHGKWTYCERKAPRELRERCRCKREGSAMKCHFIFERERFTIFENFWKNFTWEEKKTYVNDTVKVQPTKRKRNQNTTSKSRRKQSFIYYLRVNRTDFRVCKTMYINTLGLSCRTVHIWKSGIQNGKETSKLRNETCHTNPYDELKHKLFEFFDSLPTMESNDCRPSTNKKYLLPEWASKQSLYNFYAGVWCVSKNTVPLSKTSFNKEFESRNLSLFRPKTDRCEKCAQYDMGYLSEQDFKLHLEKREAYLEKKKCAFTADLQTVL